MIFYEVEEAGGHFLVATQADAKRESRERKCTWSQTDIPTDKAGLMAHINGLMLKAPEPVEEAAEPFVAPPPKPIFNTGQPAPGRPGGPRLFSAGADNDLICEAIEESDGNSLARFAEAVACRFAALAKKEAVHG